MRPSCIFNCEVSNAVQKIIYCLPLLSVCWYFLRCVTHRGFSALRMNTHVDKIVVCERRIAPIALITITGRDRDEYWSRFVSTAIGTRWILLAATRRRVSLFQFFNNSNFNLFFLPRIYECPRFLATFLISLRILSLHNWGSLYLFISTYTDFLPAVLLLAVSGKSHFDEPS